MYDQRWSLDFSSKVISLHLSYSYRRRKSGAATVPVSEYLLTIRSPRTTRRLHGSWDNQGQSLLVSVAILQDPVTRRVGCEESVARDQPRLGRGVYAAIGLRWWSLSKVEDIPLRWMTHRASLSLRDDVDPAAKERGPDSDCAPIPIFQEEAKPYEKVDSRYVWSSWASLLELTSCFNVTLRFLPSIHTNCMHGDVSSCLENESILSLQLWGPTDYRIEYSFSVIVHQERNLLINKLSAVSTIRIRLSHSSILTFTMTRQ